MTPPIWPGRRRQGRIAVARCEDARETISARRDGERAALPHAALDEHLAACPECRRFAAAIGRLEVRLHVGPSRPPSASLVAEVSSLLGELRPVGWPTRVRRAVAALGGSGRRAARWSAALAPALLLVVVGALTTGASVPQAHPPRPVVCSPKVLRW